MHGRQLIRLGLGLLAVCATSSALFAQQFSVVTKVVQPVRDAAPGEPQEEVVAKSLTMFHAGKVFDWLPAVGEVTVFEPAHERFIIFNGQRMIATTVSFEQIQQLLDAARDETKTYVRRLEQRGDATTRSAIGPLKFHLDPDFSEEFVASSKHLKLASPQYSYQVDCGTAPIPEATGEYLEYTDWAARLNYVLHPRNPFPNPRLELNNTLRRRSLIPLRVQVNVEFDRPLVLQAHHRFVWKFEDQDRQHIEHWESKIRDPDLKWVSFRDYQQTVLQAVAHAK